MIKTLLIANRGEIACRIIRTAKELGIKTVAIYSEADSDSLHVKQADKAIYIGPSAASQSYLKIPKIIKAIEISGADAVHPGYGFLSENPDFVAKLEKLGINFVGPASDSIRKMGDKIEAKKIAKKAGVNVVPGVLAEIKDSKEAVKIAKKIGFPIMIKAAAGGGGKGMRIVRDADEMEQAFSSTRNEAKNNFSDERTFIEKYIENPRHIEIQLLGDKHGNYVCLGERECSIQRHHQKIIEEAPSVFIDDKTRKKMYKQSVALAKKVGYFSAGTIEFIVDAKQNFYFMEMNTRLQVEHPVTEHVTGVDLVEQMIKVANGEKLGFRQRDVEIKGWSIESRICAEDPSLGFLPSTGQITLYKEPPKSKSVRVDSGVFEGGEVSMYYDAMISKLITYASNREDAIEEMKHALSKYFVEGISTNIGFLQAIYGHGKFVSGEISTNFLSQEFKDGYDTAELSDEENAVLISAAAHIHFKDVKRDNRINGQIRGHQQYMGTRWVVSLDDKKYPITVRPIENGYKITFMNRRLYITSDWILGTKLFECEINGKNYSLQIEYLRNGYNLNIFGRTVRVVVQTPRVAELSKYLRPLVDEEEESDILANISGKIVDIKVGVGDEVGIGQPVLILEAMKMENIMHSKVEGVVKKINFKPGDNVSVGNAIIEFE